MSKYFIKKSTGVVLEVNETVMVGEGKNASQVVAQYEKRPEIYTPCDKDGKPLKADKAEPQGKAPEDTAKGAKPAAK